MTVVEFTEAYTKLQAESAQRAFLKEKIKYKTYLPITLKQTICNNILDSTCFEKSKNDVGVVIDKKIKLNLVAKMIFYKMSLIQYYTNLEIDFKNCSDEYDQLNALGIVDKIISGIRKEERAEMDEILHLEYEAMLVNETSFSSALDKQVAKVSDLVNATATVADNLVTTLKNNHENGKIGNILGFKK